jgi:hypothetical protein
MGTYNEHLRITWLMFWRGGLMGLGLGAAAGALLGAILGFLGQSQWVQPLASAFGLLLALFVACPISAGMALRKRYRGFRLQLVREP